MDTFEVFKLIHVVFAMIWVGGSVLVGIFGFRLQNASPEHRLGFARDMRFVSTWVFLPSAVIVYLAGSLAVEEVRPLFDYEQTWIGIGTIGVLVAFLTGATFLAPQIRKAVKLMEAGQGPQAGAVIRRVTIVSRVIIVILLVVVWAMVTKPGL
jgi:putative copper export protein